jgi:hypothetical protein
MRHIGRRTAQLELDLATDESLAAATDPSRRGAPLDNSRLVVLGRWDLGADPHEVAQTLQDAGFPVDPR